MGDASEPSEHAHRPEGDEVVDRHVPAQDHAVFELDVAGEQRAIGHGDPVAHDAVVGDVRTGHEEIVVSYDGDAASLEGAGVHRTPALSVVVVDHRTANRKHVGLRAGPDTQEGVYHGAGNV